MGTCIPGTELPPKTDYDPYLYQNFSMPLPDPIPVWEISLKITFYVVAFLVDIVGNSLVVLIIVMSPRMRTPTNMLLLNLAVSDLMVGFFCMWVHAGNSVTVEWPFGPYVCKVNTFIQVLAVTSSVLTLTAISVERFFAIVFPLKSRMTGCHVTFIVIANWLMAGGMASPHLVIRRQFEYYWKNRHEVWCDEVWTKVYIDTECNTKTPGKVIYYTIEGVVMYFIPVLVMMATYTMIVCKMIFRKQPGTVVMATISAHDRSRKKVIRMLIAVLTAFVICWTPQQVILLWNVYRPTDTGELLPPYIKEIKYTALYIAYFNSALNPILYGGFNENFRKGFRDAFHCILWKRHNTVAPAGNESQRDSQRDATPSRIFGVNP